MVFMLAAAIWIAFTMSAAIWIAAFDDGQERVRAHDADQVRRLDPQPWLCELLRETSGDPQFDAQCLYELGGGHRRRRPRAADDAAASGVLVMALAHVGTSGPDPKYKRAKAQYKQAKARPSLFLFERVHEKK